MPLNRRNLPPLPALCALEALDRLGSASAVAKDQNLSQSAISRQLQTLETQLDLPLFQRDGRALQLTDQARAYAAEVRLGLQQISDATLRLRLPPQGGALSLAILPSFGMRWLVPRLPDFARRHPEITVNLTTQLEPFPFTGTGFDAALHFDHIPWPGTHSLPLMREFVEPVGTPEFLANRPYAPEALSALPLLHIATRPNAWHDWFKAQGSEVTPPAGTTFDQFTTIIQAVLHGLGLGLLPQHLIAEERAAGALVPATNAPPLSLGGYHLVWPKSRTPSAALIAFRDWLATQAEDEDRLPR